LLQTVGNFLTFTFHKVVYNTESTLLMCVGTFNDHFITRSLMGLRVKKVKIGQHLPKLWAIKLGDVFTRTT